MLGMHEMTSLNGRNDFSQIGKWEENLLFPSDKVAVP
jgi:hypothetical protein